jgi:hypothetical protein
LLILDGEPINNLQEKSITLIKLKLNHHVRISIQQLMDYILKLERNSRYFYNIEKWFDELNLLPENFQNLKEGVISFDEFVLSADIFVRSLQQREFFSLEADENES